MTWLSHLRRWAGIRRLAKSLPPLLNSGWGKAEFYTPGQVASALKRLKLAGRYDMFAYAGYLTPQDFEALTRRASDYDEYREAFLNALPKRYRNPYAFEPISNSEAARRHGIY